ncbi:MAG: DUF4190 domain-containing protein [Actinomycetota bacterium]|nr:DUF4190 domain-containing protein [Actinomycetota bacterium]
MTDPSQPAQPSAYQPPYQPQYQRVPDHPQATTVLVLGILGLVLCGVIAPFAWAMGNRVQGEIDTARGALGGRSSASAGRIMGIIGTVMLLGFVLFIVAMFAFFGLAFLGIASTTTSP